MQDQYKLGNQHFLLSIPNKMKSSISSIITIRVHFKTDQIVWRTQPENALQIDWKYYTNYILNGYFTYMWTSDSEFYYFLLLSKQLHIHC